MRRALIALVVVAAITGAPRAYACGTPTVGRGYVKHLRAVLHSCRDVWGERRFAAKERRPLAASPAPVEMGMHWYRWHHASTRSLQRLVNAVATTAVLGVTTVHELVPLERRYGFQIIRTLPALHAAEVRVSRSLVTGARRDRRIRYLSPLGPPRRLTALPNDPLLSTFDPWTRLPYEWQFEAAHVEHALDLLTGTAQILVGTIDSGAADVPDLSGKVDQRWAVSRNGQLTRDGEASDIVGHGTAVASLIASNVGDGFGMAGFGGTAHLIVVRAWTFTDLSTAAALMKLDSLGVRIVNMSFGGDAPETPVMLDAIHQAAADGMLLVAAAGNSSHAVAHPAADLQPADGAQSYGLAVGASDVHGDRALFSNAGPNLSMLAPGGYDGDCSGVLVAAAPAPTAFAGTCYPTWAGDGGALYAYVSGTSFAAPEVAGAAALVWAARPELTNYQVADILKRSARRATDSWTPTTGFGVLDAGAAVELALSRSDADWAAAASAGRTAFTVKSSLAGTLLLPHRIRWDASTSFPESKVREVDFFIDGKLAWVERRMPYSYRHGNYLPTSRLRPGIHRFAVIAIAEDGTRAIDSSTARTNRATTQPRRSRSRSAYLRRPRTRFRSPNDFDNFGSELVHGVG